MVIDLFVRLSAVCVTVVTTGRTLAKIKIVKYVISFLDFDICHRMASLRKWDVMTVTNFFALALTVSLKRLELAQKCKDDFCNFDIRHQGTTLRKLFSVTLNYFLKVKNSKR